MLVGACGFFASGFAGAAEDLYDAYLPLVRHEQQIGFGLTESAKKFCAAAARSPRPPCAHPARAWMPTTIAN